MDDDTDAMQYQDELEIRESLIRDLCYLHHCARRSAMNDADNDSELDEMNGSIDESAFDIASALGILREFKQEIG